MFTNIEKFFADKFKPLLASLFSLSLIASGLGLSNFEGNQAEARTRAKKTVVRASSRSSAKAGSRRGKTASSRGSSGRKHTVARGRHHGKVAHAHKHSAPKTRYAYPIGIFMARPPAFDTSPLSEPEADRLATAFKNGTADSYAARELVRAGIVKYHPLRGGIFWRREPVKYIVMHSTETGIPISAVRVIESWSSMGIRHPGAQYVVERDGTIYQAVDPDLATVHVNIFKTLPGINNDNSIGIEMNHTGSQDYPPAMMNSVIKLVAYLQNRYNVQDANIITHRYAQQGDHTDPVHFDWDGFIATKNGFKNQAIAYRSKMIKDDSRNWKSRPEPAVNTYLKIHQPLETNKKTGVVEESESVEAGSTFPKPESKPESKSDSKLEPKVEVRPESNQGSLVTPPAALPNSSEIAPTPPTSPQTLPQALPPSSPQIENGAELINALPAKPKVQMIKGVRLLPAETSSTVRFYPPGYFKNSANQL
ncbi:MAG: N-acetylmuramoyl-L-alanine amidase [Candidatus Obscuribacterales bacterium]|nr:N-acetylmuramoyl-L-alanine amidase [Candidatus Obscuribacterales bacterium]